MLLIYPKSMSNECNVSINLSEGDTRSVRDPDVDPITALMAFIAETGAYISGQVKNGGITADFQCTAIIFEDGTKHGRCLRKELTRMLGKELHMDGRCLFDANESAVQAKSG